MVDCVLTMRHVFVETNWIFDYAAPAYRKGLDAVELLARAGRGELMLHLPALCITEARNSMPSRYQPEADAETLRGFLSWARNTGRLTADHTETTLRAVDQLDAFVLSELKRLPETLDTLRSRRNLEVFALNDAMLERAVNLAFTDLWLKPFDQSVLAAVLVRARELWNAGERDLCFCELDRDLQPWDRRNQRRASLADLYDEARVWVYEDFTLTKPVRPAGWPANPVQET